MFMARFEEQTYALLRIVVGFLFAGHGLQKLFGYPIPPAADAPAWVLYIPGPIELIGGALIMFGLFTRWTAFLCSGLMAFAYWLAHGTSSFFPIANGGEEAAFYCFVFLFLAARGSGIWSLAAARAAARAAAE